MLAFRVWIHLLFDNIKKNKLCVVFVISVQGNTRNLQVRQNLLLCYDRDHITHYWIHFHSISIKFTSSQKISPRCFWILSHRLQLDPKIGLCPFPHKLQYAYRYLVSFLDASNPTHPALNSVNCSYNIRWKEQIGKFHIPLFDQYS